MKANNLSMTQKVHGGNLQSGGMNLEPYGERLKVDAVEPNILAI